MLEYNLQFFGGRGASGTMKNWNGKTADKKPTEKQIDAIEYYVSGEGMWINQYFRKNGEGFGELTDNEKEFVKDLDKALDRKVKDEVLYRSVDAKAIFGDNVDFYYLREALGYGVDNRYQEQALKMAQQAIGKTITEKGYISATRDANIAENFGDFTGSENPIVLKIKTSPNTKGMNVSNLNKRMAEVERDDPQKETLLARNQSYKVQKMYYKNGQIYVDIKMR